MTSSLRIRPLTFLSEASSSPSSAKGAQSKKEKKKAAAAKGGKTNSKKKVDSNADPNQLPKNYKMRTCVEAYNRVKWDKSCNTADFMYITSQAEVSPS